MCMASVRTIDIVFKLLQIGIYIIQNDWILLNNNKTMNWPNVTVNVTQFNSSNK